MSDFVICINNDANPAKWVGSRCSLSPPFCRFGLGESTNGTADSLGNRCTLVNTPLCYWYSSETAGVEPEEGGDDVKSSWPCRNKVAVGEESGWIISFLRILSIVRMATFETNTVEPELQMEIARRLSVD